jgi:hypothetical protein
MTVFVTRSCSIVRYSLYTHCAICKVVFEHLHHCKDYNKQKFIGFEVFTAVVLKSIFFWDMTPCSAQVHLLARCFAELFYDPEDGGDTFLRNVGYHSAHYTASYPRRKYSSNRSSF